MGLKMPILKVAWAVVSKTFEYVILNISLFLEKAFV